MASTLPSQFLPPLQPPPAPSTLRPLLSTLRARFLPSHTLVDLAHILTPSHPQSDGLEETESELGDAFELDFVRGWLERLVMLGSRLLARAQGDELQWEHLVEDAASLVAGLAGDCASSGTTITYTLPTPMTIAFRSEPIDFSASNTLSPFYPTPPPTRPMSPLPQASLAITIRSTTLLANSTGFRTWSSASILAASIASNPLVYFPPRSASGNRALPLRVLELGAGTGLAGLTAAAVLGSLERRAEVHLTDCDQPVLENLAHNIAGNDLLASACSAVSREAFRLDWTDFARPAADSVTPPSQLGQQRYDLILGADLVYEPEQLRLLHPTISRLLRFPAVEPGASERERAGCGTPRCYLVVPVRPTHSEHRAVDAAFAHAPPPADSPAAQLWPSCSQDELGNKWVLRAVTREEVSAHDGFTGKAQGGLRLHWVYRIEWVPWSA